MGVRSRVFATVMSGLLAFALVPAPALAEGVQEIEDVEARESLNAAQLEGDDDSLGQDSRDAGAISSNTTSDTSAGDSTAGGSSAADDPAQESQQNGGQTSDSTNDDGLTPAEEEPSDGDTESDAVPEDEDVVEDAEELEVREPILSYSAHVQDIGWQTSVSAGETAGTTGQGKRVEALRVSIGQYDDGSAISVDAHVQNIGWQGVRSSKDTADGQVEVGTVGQSKRVEALRIALEGPVAEKYDVWYRVYAQDEGWLGWASNGASAGTSGVSKRIEAVQITVLPKDSPAPGSTDTPYMEEKDFPASVRYKAHVQNIGWQSVVSDGETAGTTGRSLAVEALDVELWGGIAGSVAVNAHVQDIGWQGYRDASTGAVVGTTGQSKRIEAIQAKLTSSEASSGYDLYYRVHVKDLGWLGWAKNGDTAGTTGLGLRVEAVEFKLVAKGNAAPGSTDRPYVAAPTLSYRAHVQDIGWQGWAGSGSVAGTTGRCKRVEALEATASGVGQTGEIQINAHVQDIGWQGFKSQGQTAGTTGQGKRVEALQIRLTGTLAQTCDVWYRVHVQDLGWMGWTKNGGYAGTTGCSARIEALQIIVQAKGSAAPGSTWRAYTDEPSQFSADPAMYRQAQQYWSRTNWLVLVDYGKCRVGIFERNGTSWSMNRYFVCSDGKYSTPTKHGQFTIGSRGYSFGDSDHTCYWWTQISGDYLFHSVLYYPGTFNVKDGRLGEHVSMGCVRLDINNAKWIHDNIPTGTKVVIYN